MDDGYLASASAMPDSGVSDPAAGETADLGASGRIETTVKLGQSGERANVVGSVRSLSATFRADTDQSGEWYVWTRLGQSRLEQTGLSSGWATMQRCESRELAQRLADDLNERALRVAV